MQKTDITNSYVINETKSNNNIKVFFPFHMGTGNRGCEGIIRGINRIFDFSQDKVMLLNRDSFEKDLDTKLGINQIGKLYTIDALSDMAFPKSYILRLLRKIGLFRTSITQLQYEDFFSNSQENDWVFFTGGDLYCYQNMISINNSISKLCRKKKLNLILYGCSIEPSCLNKKAINELNKFDAIITRESLSTNALKTLGISDNVFQCPDPAFSLQPIKTDLPDCFSSDVVGLNISNLVNKPININDTYERSLCVFIDYLLDNTSLNILLIPHVTWFDQDDRVICSLIYEKYKQTKRISMLSVEELNYLHIRYIISKCRFFLGARTHSVISAYSTYVPSIALGYSVKSRGIAKDIGLPNDLVVNCKNLRNDSEILNAFMFLFKNEEKVKSILHNNMPKYCEESFKGKEYIELRI